MTDRVSAPGPARDLFDWLTGDEDARVCADISDEACREQPRNFLIHVAALVATKTGDRLASPKLVLSWLLTSLGAPAFMLGVLVPVRESLALLPQLLVAHHLRARSVRKWFWVAGSAIQGGCVAAMALVSLSLEGARAGWAILTLLVAFSLARGVCSVTSKDVLGKTIAKTRRGSVSGYAASAAGVGTVVAGVVALSVDFEQRSATFFAAALMIAGALWWVAATVYAQLAEAPGASEGGGNALAEALRQLRLMKEDAQLRRFVVTRTLLLSTALAAPFHVALASTATSGLGGLGSLLIATGVAGLLSAPLWGRFSDRSSRRVMMVAAVLAAASGLVSAALSRSQATPGLAYAGSYFVLAIAHAGVRLGRKTHLVDMATEKTRASYVAVSNTVIGLMLLAASGIGALVPWIGSAGVLVVLAALSLLGAASAFRLEEVQR